MKRTYSNRKRVSRITTTQHLSQSEEEEEVVLTPKKARTANASTPVESAGNASSLPVVSARVSRSKTLARTSSGSGLASGLASPALHSGAHSTRSPVKASSIDVALSGSQASAASGSSKASRPPALSRSSTLPSPTKKASILPPPDPFSQLFAAQSPSKISRPSKPTRSAARGGGVIGRMLGRSKTDGTVTGPAGSSCGSGSGSAVASSSHVAASEISTSASIWDSRPAAPFRSYSGSGSVSPDRHNGLGSPSIPSKDQDEDTQHSQVEFAMNTNANTSMNMDLDLDHSPSRPSLRAHARTYGGASRSFLVNVPAASAAASRLLQDGTGELDLDTYNTLAGTSTPLANGNGNSQSQSQSQSVQSQYDDELNALDAEAGRESYSVLRARLGVDPSSDDVDLDDLPLEQEEEDEDREKIEQEDDDMSMLSPTKGRQNGRSNGKSNGSTKGTPKGMGKGDVKSNGKGKNNTNPTVKGKTKTKTKAKISESLPRLPKPAPLPPGMMNDLKSITELRSKGESRKFLDDVGYLFEGLDMGAPIGVRRGSALEIVTKLCDPDFARKAKAVDYLHKTWDEFRAIGAGDGDKILDIILVLFCALLGHSSSEDLIDLAEKTDMASVMLGLLPRYSREKDVVILLASGVGDAELKRAGVARTEKAQLLGLLNLFRKKSGLSFADDTVRVTTSIVRVLSTLPARLLPARSINVVLEHLLSELRHVSTRLQAFTAGLPILSETSDADPDTAVSTEAPSLEDLEHTLRLLDSYLLGRWQDAEHDHDIDIDTAKSSLNPLEVPSTRRSLVRGLVALLAVSMIIERKPEYAELHETSHGCIAFAFRVLTNLSHGSPEWCRIILEEDLAISVAIRPVVCNHAPVVNHQRERGDEEEDDPEENKQNQHAFDQVCLGLALLTNLVQGYGSSKSRIHTVLDPNCVLKPACFRGQCQCPGATSALTGLVQTYLKYGQTTANADVDESGAAFLRGHLAILFGLLMEGDADAHAIILAALPGSIPSAKLDDVLEDARQFVSFYDSLADDGGQNSVRTLAIDSEHGNTAAKSLRYLESLQTCS